MASEKATIKLVDLSWLGFWLCLSVYIGAEAMLYVKGHNTFFWRYETPAELELQKAIIENTREARDAWGSRH